jgi:uncharacterized protein YkwD
MKRAVRVALLGTALLYAGFTPGAADESRAADAASAPASVPAATDVQTVLAWVNELRGRSELPELEVDPLLSRTAAAYAAELASSGILSHVDERGRRALERLHARGGTSVLVGEILASGPDLAKVIPSWEASRSHSELAAGRRWTHLGAASAPSSTTRVWVVLFAREPIHPLRILPSEAGILVRGRLSPAGAREPVLISGVEELPPLRWDAGSREFCFLIPPGREDIYHRLGYRSRTGALVVTDTFFPRQALTSAPERGLRPDASRCVEPAGSPEPE